MSRVVITGGAGFIGSRLSHVFADRGFDVAIIDDMSSSSGEFLPDNVELYPYAIEEIEYLGIPIDCDVLIHLAALPGVEQSVKYPHLTFQSNVVATNFLFDQIEKNDVGRVIFTSSSSVYGARVSPQHEQLALTPRSPYAASKMMGEAMTHSFAAMAGRPAFIIRPFNVYGPGQTRKGAVIPEFCRSILKKEPFKIHGDGEQSRDFTFVDDLCELYYLAATCEMSNDPVENWAIVLNGCNKATTSINEIAMLLSFISGIANHEDHVPSRVGDVRISHGLNDTAKSVLGWEPMTDITTGLDITFQWWKERFHDG